MDFIYFFLLSFHNDIDKVLGYVFLPHFGTDLDFSEFRARPIRLIDRF